MTLQVNVGEAKTRLSELIAKVEAGEAVVIARDGAPVVELRRVERDRTAAMEAAQRLIARRTEARRVTTEEILAWRDEGRR